MKSELAQKVLTRRIKDYSYAVVFFLIFSFFIFFAIRPNIATALTLKKELAELKTVNENYEQAIRHIITVQTVLEKHRSEYHLLSDALPATPQVNKIVEDLYTVSSSSGLLFQDLNIGEVNLKRLRKKSYESFLSISKPIRDLKM